MTIHHNPQGYKISGLVCHDDTAGAQDQRQARPPAKTQPNPTAHLFRFPTRQDYTVHSIAHTGEHHPAPTETRTHKKQRTKGLRLRPHQLHYTRAASAYSAVADHPRNERPPRRCMASHGLMDTHRARTYVHGLQSYSYAHLTGG
ncbi:hypothetical protein PVAP13_9KG472126 [Panicum virgatum]|uniref:Uncharacterized protein n=1 Tax=Panicum virgatum TaxID=38727 RepID=A0A8T0NT40_PANVG|nr:hypothetical protein PVAP13_9KG472126 [Panicum virgatum]